MKNMPYRPNMSTKMKNINKETSGEAGVRVPAPAERDIGVKKQVIENRIELLIKKISYRFIDAEVYVSSIEELEDYDAGFLYLHVVRDKFSLGDINVIRRIIKSKGFTERSDITIIGLGNKVELVFDLRW
jgi:hypothetical protein